jgi:hypothetical protein
MDLSKAFAHILPPRYFGLILTKCVGEMIELDGEPLIYITSKFAKGVSKLDVTCVGWDQKMTRNDHLQVALEPFFSSCVSCDCDGNIHIFLE